MASQGHAAVPLALGVLAWSAKRARSHRVSSTEETIFRAFNDSPDRYHAAVWPIMQSGSLAGVFVAAAVVHRRQGPRPAASVAVAGTAVWIGNKLVKQLVGRGRPNQLLDEVLVRGQPQSGTGFPSGHAAVATTLAIVTTSTAPGRCAALCVAAMTGAGRVYAGAHLPLDVVGGFALGTIAGVLTRRAPGAH